MKAIAQRVTKAAVRIEGNEHSAIGAGALVFLGVHKEDTEDDIEWMTRKLANMRIFEDEKGLMNSDLQTIAGDLLVISQFTLIASVRKGNRPSFNDAAPPEKGKAYYEAVVAKLGDVLKQPVKTGVFAANMKVSLINDGPVTLVFDSRNRE